jgi:hypothetical protein
MNPNPVQLNDPRMLAILKASKQVLKKVESGDYQTGNVDGRALNEEGINEMQAEGITRSSSTKPPVISENRLQNSKMPDSIKKIMAERPIPRGDGLGAGNTNQLEGLEELIDKPLPHPKTPQPKKRTMNENSNSSYSGGLNEEEIRAIFKEEIIEFMSTYFVKTISEQTRKTMLDQMLKEGLIKKK